MACPGRRRNPPGAQISESTLAIPALVIAIKPASSMASALGLTRGATTTALDRLGRAGYVARRESATDGRSVLVDLTADGRAKVQAIWRPVRTLGPKHLESYSARELRILISFFGRSTGVQERSLAEIFAQGIAPSPPET
jgi:DNA-binding MarR family transcriptional regulator